MVGKRKGALRFKVNNIGRKPKVNRNVPLCDNSVQTFFTKRKLGRQVQWVYNMSQYKVCALNQDSEEELECGQQIVLSDAEECGDHQEEVREYTATPKAELAARAASTAHIMSPTHHSTQEILELDDCIQDRQPVPPKRTGGNKRKQTSTTTSGSSKKRKQVHQVTQSTLLDCLMIMIPLILREQVEGVMKKLRTAMWDENRKEKSQHRVSVLKTIVKALAMYQIDPSQSHSSFQSYLGQSPDTTFESLHIDAPTESFLMKLFDGSETPAQSTPFPRDIERNKCTSSRTMQQDPRETTSTYSTPAIGSTASAGVGDLGSSGTYLSATPTQQMLQAFQPRMSSSSRSITFSVGNRLFTQRWPGNQGDFYVKLEVYRAQDIQASQPKDWWRYALHRSQVYMGRDEEQFKMITRAAEIQRTLWVSPDGQKAHSDVELTGGIKPEPPQTSDPLRGLAWGGSSGSTTSW